LKIGMYKLTFVTGVRRGAGTKARARVVLCGEAGKSESFLLGGRDDDAGGFITGSRRVYYVNAGINLGEIFRVDVELADYSIAEVGCRWFLDQVRDDDKPVMADRKRRGGTKGTGIPSPTMHALACAIRLSGHAHGRTAPRTRAKVARGHAGPRLRTGSAMSLVSSATERIDAIRWPYPGKRAGA